MAVRSGLKLYNNVKTRTNKLYKLYKHITDMHKKCARTCGSNQHVRILAVVWLIGMVVVAAVMTSDTRERVRFGSAWRNRQQTNQPMMQLAVTVLVLYYTALLTSGHQASHFISLKHCHSSTA